MTTVAIDLPDEAATARLGRRLARWIESRPGGVVYLEGTLGAGKTTLMRAVLRALGVAGPIRSPTYTLVEPYAAAGRSVLHADLYRLRDPAELYQLGIEDQPPAQAWWWVEWPERGAGVLPPADAVIRLRIAGAGRRADVEVGAGRETLLAALPPDGRI